MLVGAYRSITYATVLNMEHIMKFRTKYLKHIGYFGQVKSNRLSGWKTIGKHTNGFGLYPNDDIDYPITTADEAIERCVLYERWLNNSKQTIEYVYL